MKKNLIKLMAALLAALILAAPVMALAEGESTEPTPAPVVEVKEEATPAAEAPKAEEPAPATEAPKAEEPAPAAAEQPVVTEQPVAATVEPSQPTAEPVATNTPVPAPEKFTGRVEVKRVGGGELHFGDRVTLKAVVSKANVKYSIRWEAMINGAWKKLGTDEKYEFTVTKENAGLSYRAVVVADKKANEKESDVFKLPTVTEAPVEEEPATEELVAEQPAAEEPAA
ncbi:MAG: hypothetical protein Q4C10_15925, partial [Clostridia bacterium]|nr:hypothetical protein [Clostridia bacterium]